MPGTLIKCCGLMSAADILAVNTFKPDFAGFIMSRPFRRYVPADMAAKFKRNLNPGIMAVGVFVNEPPEYPAGLYNSGTIDMIQLHGNEDDKYIENLRRLLSLRHPADDTTYGGQITKAFKISSRDDIDRAVSSCADYILLDSGTGTGKTFDWSLLEHIERKWFLAGGLGPDNVREAIERFHPFAVDASSGLETGGAKDPDKIRDFIHNARMAAM